MTTAKMTAVAAIFWAGGFASTAALAYMMNRPIHLQAAPMTALAETPGPEALAELLPPPPELVPARIIVLPTVEIVGQVNGPAAPHQRDISEMHCAPWRPLKQGSNAVQLCD